MVAPAPAATIYRREPNGKGDGIFRTNAGNHPTCIRVRAYGLLKERWWNIFGFMVAGSLPLGIYDKYLSIAFHRTRLYIYAKHIEVVGCWQRTLFCSAAW